jgi:frataxin-like iron-binding protein CyaY
MNRFSGKALASAILLAGLLISGCVPAPAVVKEESAPPKAEAPAEAKPAKQQATVRPTVIMPPLPPEKTDAEILEEAKLRAAALRPVVDSEIAMVRPGPIPEPEVKKPSAPVREAAPEASAQKVRKPVQQLQEAEQSSTPVEDLPAVAAAPVEKKAPPAPRVAPADAGSGKSSNGGVFSSAEAPSLTSMATFTTSNGLPENLVTAVFVDESDAWVGTNGGGVARFNFAENNWIITKKVDGLISDFVTDITKYKGRIFVGTDVGVAIWDGIAWQNKQTEDKLELANSTFALGDSTLWLAARNMRGGLLEFDGEKWLNRSNIRAGVILNNVSAMAFDKKEIWLGTTSRGLYVKRARDWEIFSVTEGIASNFIYSIAVKEDKAFLGGCCGLSYYDGSRWTIFDVPDGLSHSTVNDVVYDGDIVWLGTKNGLCAYNGEEFTSYYAEDGVLVDNRVTSIFVRGDELWIGTAGGLSRLKKGE